MEELEALVGEWMTLPDVAEQLSVDVGKVRRMVQDGQLVAVRRGERNVLSIPAALLGPEGLLPHLQGTISVLADAGYEGVEALVWLFSPDGTIAGGSPIGALREGQRTEVRRRAQALA